MINVELSLGPAEIRKLSRRLKRLRNQLKRTDFAEEMLVQAQNDMLKQVAHVAGIDGNYDATTVDYVEQLGIVSWRGEQVSYLEYGTGAKGAARPYAGVLPSDYHPDPTNKEWDYVDKRSGALSTSYSLAPQAPMYKTALKARRDLRSGNSPIHRKVREILNEVTTR